MNINIAVIGAPKVGKTLFCINFAEYLGARNLCYTESGPYGRGKGVLTPEAARKSMVSPGPRCNGVVRSFAVNMLRWDPLRLLLVDTASLKDTTPLPKRERAKLVLTLQALHAADAVLYLIDLPCSDPARVDFAFNIHRNLTEYCLNKVKPYLLIGTKLDQLNENSAGHKHYFTPNGKILPVSSITREGFPELRRLLLKMQGDGTTLSSHQSKT